MNDQAPDLIEPVEGWRSWYFDPISGLHSVFAKEVWTPGEDMEARCELHLRMETWLLASRKKRALIGDTHFKYGNEAPAKGCRCGLYAATGGRYMVIPKADVYGKVALWGKVIPGEFASRGQYARPVELYAPKGLMNNELLQQYGVPIYPLHNLPFRLWLIAKIGKPVLALVMAIVFVAFSVSALTVLAYTYTDIPIGLILAGVWGMFILSRLMRRL